MKRLPAVLLTILVLLQLAALLLAPAAWQPANIRIALQAGESLTLGERELAAPQAESRQLTLRRNSKGDWFASNAGNQRQPMIRYAEHDIRMGHTALQPGMQFQIGPQRFTVSASTPDAVSIRDDHNTWHYDGALLRRDGEVLPACPGSSLHQRLAQWWNRFAHASLSLARPVLLGGSVHCGNRMGIATTEPGSASLRRAVDGQLVLTAAAGQVVRVTDGQAEQWLDAGMAEHPLAGAHALLVGRSLLSVGIRGDTLTLTPKRHTSLLREPVIQLPGQVQWSWNERQLWTVSGAGGMFALLALILAAVLHKRVSAMAAACLVAGLCAFISPRWGQPVPVALSIGVGACACWFLLRAGRGHLLSVSASLLAAAGLLVQLELGLGAMETSWLRHVQKTSALLAIGVGAGMLLAQGLQRRKLSLTQIQLEVLLAALALLALCGLALQVLLGDETGVFDLQPVEFAKLALAAVTAHCLAVGLGWHSNNADDKELRLRWLRLTAPALLFIALLGLALVQVNDFSPLILLAIWLFCMLLAYAAAARRIALMAALGGLMLTGCLALGWLRSSGAEQLSNAGFYGDRFQVWVDPALHPHTGQQFLLGAKAIAEGGWRGADGWLGVSNLGEAAGAVMSVPAVQDDFAPAFLLNRHGLASALGLWALQFLFLLGLIHAAASAHREALAARHYRQAWLGRWRYFALAGGAAFVAGHLLLSWGTNLSIFPIMGQPMSFLSSGGSHLLLFLCPLLALGVVSTQSNEEKSSCQSMSNAKCSAK
jgi:cell division protein FtsW